ncbi:PAS domain S-box protein [Alkalihalobacillus hwajinpoensis]|uniref:ATP-binding protein n=1 Tax=Guptibacillus hwajinpoensis TaxID=208199 RepID=UPI001883CA4B|nr:ATP-binding protein [Pseudalkalibacillus hwajinpoensis]MBF0708946.1 PAS domain S-box protein [Pseudalkalibacillus hwajinpoensis]
MKRYKGRIISVVTFLIAILLWDYWLYSVNGIKINWLMDIFFTISVMVIVWWYSSYYDRSVILLSKLKDSEEKYRKLSENYNSVINSLNEVVFQTGIDGSWIWLNQAWGELTGYDVQESIGTYSLSYIHPDDRLNLHKELSRFQDGAGNSNVFEFRVQKKGGGFVWCEVFIKYEYSSKGSFEGMTGTIKDKTFRKQSEERLLKTNEALAVKSEKLASAAQLAAGIAHEVRNPLTSVKGFLQLLEKKESTMPYFEIIFSEISRIELVLSELLTLAKPHSTLFTNVEMKGLLKQVSTLIESNALLNDVTLQTSFGDEEAVVFANPNQMKQVCINLMKNAIEAMSHMEQSKYLHLSMDVQEMFISVRITDNGAGISKEDIDRLGEPFFTTKESGTGLGLSVCLKIIEQHGGELLIESEEGRGSTFEMKLPRLMIDQHILE